MSKKETIKFVVQLIGIDCIGDTDGTWCHIVRRRVERI